MSAAYEAGQRVHLRNVNERRMGTPEMGTVVKIGRTLVHVEGRHGRVEKYRLEDGYGTGPYGHHAWIQTEEERAAEERRADLLDRLKAGGLEVPFGTRVDDDTLARVVAALEGGAR